MQDVLKFFCLNFGCQHKRGELFLSNGCLDVMSTMGQCTLGPVCKGTFANTFLPVFRYSVISFIDWLTATAKLPFPIDSKQQISLLLMLSTYWKEMIFDKASSLVSCSNMDALILSLAAAGILEIKIQTMDLCGLLADNLQLYANQMSVSH
jgi:hypothetical protein